MQTKLFIKILLGLMLPLAINSIAAQSSMVGTYWHDGKYFYSVETEDDTAIWVNMLSLHEGGGADPWAKTQNPNVFKCCYEGGDEKESCDSVSRININGLDLMLLYGPDKKLNNILKRYDGQSKNKYYAFSHGFDTIQEKDNRTRIKGRYAIPKTDMVWIITDDSILVSGTSISSLINKNTNYSIFWEMDYTTPVLQLGNKRYIYYEFTINGLDIFEGVLNIEADGFEWVDKGRFRYHLYKQDVDNIVPGHWPEASTMILTRGYLDPYPSAVLRYMRNEIYARKGYKFENESLASFFCQNGNWYHPSDSQEKVPLSLVEELNIQLIQSIERERKNKKTSQN